MFKVEPGSNLILESEGLHARSKINISQGNNLVEIRSGVSGLFSIQVKGRNNKIIIGENVRAFGSVEIACIRSNTEITIGKDTTFQGKVRLFSHETSQIHIGADCMFSGDILVTTSDMHAIFDKDGNRINAPAPVKIGEHVWVGSDVRILKGAVIGKGSVIGMGSLVVGGVYPDTAVIVGVPAKVVRKEICWTRAIPE